MKFKTYKVARRATGLYLEVAILEEAAKIAEDNALTTNEVLAQLVKEGLRVARADLAKEG
tara:strand:+ start:159 stop:338 length:180 start_codon:yes stop_codon:yes gene_type:complete